MVAATPSLYRYPAAVHPIEEDEKMKSHVTRIDRKLKGCDCELLGYRLEQIRKSGSQSVLIRLI